MLLIFGNNRFDLWKFPDLMTDRLRISPGEHFSAASAIFRMHGNPFRTSFDGDKFAKCPTMSVLSASLLL